MFATDPKQPAVIYAGGRDGICRSRDAGQSWTPINNGLTHRGIISIAIDPYDSSRLYADTWNGLFKSEDGGNHWLDSNEGLPRAGRRRWMSVWSIVVHPNRPLTILIGVETSQGATPQPDFAGGVFKSVDGGATWHALRAGLTDAYVMDVLVDPANPRRILAAGQYDGVFESEDGGEHWHWTSPLLRGLNTWALAIVPSTGDVLAGTFDNGIFRRDSKKTEWIATSSGLTNTGVSQVVSLRSPGYRVMRGGVLWSRSPTGWSIRGTLAEKICMGFVVHVTSDPRRLYSDGCGSLKSEDGGSS